MCNSIQRNTATWSAKMNYLIYISAICIANFLVFTFGPMMSIINSFVLIGLDMVVRDSIHDKIGIGGAMFMSLLAGGISYAINPSTGMIAIASVAAFTAAAIADAVTYQVLSGKSWMRRVNGSNVSGSIVDSMVFPIIAFGAFMPEIIIGQIVAKMSGGLMWSFIIKRWRA